VNNENGIPEKQFIPGKALFKGIEGAIIAGLSGVGGMTAVEQLESVNLSKREEVLTTAAAMILGFLFRYLRSWLKQKNRKRKGKK